MAEARLRHAFTIPEITLDRNFDTRLNVRKRREHFYYVSRTDEDNVNLAYVTSQLVNSDINVAISDKSATLPANRILENIPVRRFFGHSWTLDVDKFKITNVFSSTAGSGLSAPLFYKHVLAIEPDLDKTIVDIVLVDNDLDPLDLTDVVYDKDNNIVYNNLTNTYDSVTGEYQIYYVKYSVKQISTATVTSYVEIVNNQPIYTLATVDNLTEEGVLDEDAKVYIVDDQFSSNTFEITLPVNDYYAIQEELNSRIRILPPTHTSIRLPWYCRISNGSFFTSLSIGDPEFSVFKYNVPEFNTQHFDIQDLGVKLRSDEDSIIVSNRLVKTARDTIYYDGDTYHVEVIVRDTEDGARLAFSTNPLLLDTAFETITYTDGIRSIDQKNGFIDLKVDLKDTDTLEVTYYFTETEVEDIDIDFNPLTNRNIMGKRIIFYLVPNTLGTRTKTVYYLLVNPHGQITHTNQPDNDDLLADIVSGLYLNLDTDINLDSVINFTKKYTVEADDMSTSPKYLILADVSTNEVVHPRKALNLNVRVKGGGIKNHDGLAEEIAQNTTPEVLWITDLTPCWSGMSYPGSATYMIEIPSEVQHTNGGEFTDFAIREIVERHTAFGIYPAIRGYGCPNIIPTLVPFDTSIDVQWRSFGSDWTYNVYYSNDPNGDFAKANGFPLDDDSDGNTFTIEGLDSNSIYVVYVVGAQDRQELPDSVIASSDTTTTTMYNKVSVSTY